MLATRYWMNWAVLLACTLPTVGLLAQNQPPTTMTREIKTTETRDIPLPNSMKNMLDKSQNLAPATQPKLLERLIDQPFYTDLVKAEKRLFFGQYAEAEKAFAALKADDLAPEELPRQRVGRLEAILRQGNWAALERFDKEYAALPADQQKDPLMVALQAESLIRHGQVEPARLLLEAALKGKKLSVETPELVRLQVQLGQLLELEGQFAAAAGTYEKVVDVASDKVPDNSSLRNYLAIAINRASVLNGGGNKLFETVLGRWAKIFEDDATYWPAMVEAGRLLLVAHNAKEGGGLLALVTEKFGINNLDTTDMGVSYFIDSYAFEKAQEELTKAKTKYDGPELWALEGRLRIKQRTPEDAIPLLEKSLALNPWQPAARGWLAGAYYLRLQPEKAQAQLDAMKLSDGTVHPVTLYEAAEVLRDSRQFQLALANYEAATKQASWWAEPYNGLAQLFLQIGDTDQARVAHEKSFALDPYNLRAYNQLTLLDMLATFGRLESKNVVVRYPDAARQVIAELALDYMDSIYADVTGTFGYTPKVKTILELYADKAQFGVRTTGIPWIGTVGASTGTVIAMETSATAEANQFDWARVLRHEFTHTITLEQTNNRIPHWFTEACATSQEMAPRDWKTCQLLARRLQAGTLFGVANMSWGFIKPATPEDRPLAYAQARWTYEFITEKYTAQHIRDLLAAYGAGVSEPEAIKKVFGKTPEAFDAEFLIWAKPQVTVWGLNQPAQPSQEDVEKALAANANEPEARTSKVRLQLNGKWKGEPATQPASQPAKLVTSDMVKPNPNEPLRAAPAGAKPDAKMAAARQELQAIIKESPTYLPAQKLLGQLLLSNPKTESEGLALFEKMYRDQPDQVPARALEALAAAAMKAKDYAKATPLWEKLSQMQPPNEAPHQALAGIYLNAQDRAKAAPHLDFLVQRAMTDDRMPRLLAEIYSEQKKSDPAQDMAYRAVRLNPLNSLNHYVYAKLLQEAGKDQRAEKFWTLATQTSPRTPSYWEGLADIRGKLGDLKGASAAARKALELTETSPAKKWYLGKDN